MRILYCNKYNFEFSGTEKYLFDLMRLVRHNGHEAALFSMAGPKSADSDETSSGDRYASYAARRVDFTSPPRNPLGRLRLAAHAIYSRDARSSIRRLLRDFQPDVAHVRNIYHHLSPSILWELRRQGVPVIYHLNDFKMLCPTYNLVSHGEPCERCVKGNFWNVVAEGCYPKGRTASAVLAAEAYVHKWLNTYGKCVSLLLAPTNFVRDKMVESGWDPRDIEVLPHFQRLPLEPPSAAGPAGPDAPVLYFGRLSAEKGVADLFHAIQQTPNIRLQIAGDGPERAPLEALARNLKLQNIEFLGHIGGPALDRLIANSAFTVLPSHAYETLGKTILESYAQGRAVIATDLGSRRELVAKGETGVLYKVGDVAQLASAIQFLHTRPAIAKAMGEAGLQRVRQNHSPQSHYEALMRIYAKGTQITKKKVAAPMAPTPSLRVAFIGGRGVVSQYSGIETYYEEVGSRLAQMGHDVTIYCRNYFTPDQTHYRNMRLVRLPTLRTKHLDTLVHTLLSTFHACRQKYDIVHFHALGPALFSWIPRLFGARTIVTVQGLDWQRKKWGRVASAVLRLGERASATMPDSTIVVSRTLQDYFHRVHGIKTSFIANGTRLLPRVHGPHLASWGLEADGYVLFMGRFSPEKNCDLLIRAFESLPPDAKLVLAGGSSHTDSYVAKLRQIAGNRVQFIDWVSGDALQELLTNAALFVLPSDLEGLSLALLDAMAAGVCVLASDIPENRELVGGVGFTFQRGNIGDLARMLQLLWSDSTMRRQAGEAARLRIQELYLWPKIADAVERCYIEALKPTKARCDLPNDVAPDRIEQDAA